MNVIRLFNKSVDARAGLRGCTQVAVYLYSWVRIPLDVDFLLFLFCHRIFIFTKKSLKFVTCHSCVPLLVSLLLGLKLLSFLQKVPSVYHIMIPGNWLFGNVAAARSKEIDSGTTGGGVRKRKSEDASILASNKKCTRARTNTIHVSRSDRSVSKKRCALIFEERCVQLLAFKDELGTAMFLVSLQVIHHWETFVAT